MSAGEATVAMTGHGGWPMPSTGCELRTGPVVAVRLRPGRKLGRADGIGAVTDINPRLRYPAGATAGRVSALRRYVPARVFDKQIRKVNRFVA